MTRFLLKCGVLFVDTFGYSSLSVSMVYVTPLADHDLESSTVEETLTSFAQLDMFIAGSKSVLRVARVDVVIGVILHVNLESVKSLSQKSSPSFTFDESHYIC